MQRIPSFDGGPDKESNQKETDISEFQNHDVIKLYENIEEVTQDYN